MEFKNSNIIFNENYREPVKFIHPDDIKMKMSVEVNGSMKNGNVEGQQQDSEQAEKKPPPRTTYIETLMHLFKGNVGPGEFKYFFLN